MRRRRAPSGDAANPALTSMDADARTMSEPQRPTDGRPILSVVAPLYNEHENVEALYRRASAALDAIGLAYELLLVDDGSRDATPEMIEDLRRRFTGGGTSRPR